MTIVLKGGQVYDPANGLKGKVCDLWIEGDRIVAPPQNPVNLTVIDARGWIIAPGAIEIHAHLGGQPLTMARHFCLSEEREASGWIPPTAEIATAYLRMGYTTLMDAAMPSLTSWLTHVDLQEMVGVDRGAYVLSGDHALVLEVASHGDQKTLREILAWLLVTCGAYAIKLTNPGVATLWRKRIALSSLNDEIYPALTQRKLIKSVASAIVNLGLPHPLHLHVGNLGQPGSWRNFLQTIESLERLPAHLCHIQFYLYDEKESGLLSSAVGCVLDQLVSHTELTFDVGQVTFGPTVNLSADVQLIEWLHNLTNKAWSYQLWEGEGAMAALPTQYFPDDPVSAIQWATGLELLLRFPDPLRLFLTVDYPNGGSFTAYPQILAWLMQRDARREMLKKVHTAAMSYCDLYAIEREYTLDEIITMTSWGPARALGLLDRGHLGIGALADLRCYKPQIDLVKMFSDPVLVVKNGQVTVREGKIENNLPHGKILLVRPPIDECVQEQTTQSFFRNITIPKVQYGLSMCGKELANIEVVSCR